MKILVLLSGGLDSAVVLASLVKDHQCDAIAFDYGQPHKIELDYAEKIALHYDVGFIIQKLNAMPRMDDVVFVGRNLVFAASAISLAQLGKLDAIAVGCNQDDAVRFPDCRRVFWDGVRKAAKAYNVKVFTPLLDTPKSDIVAWAQQNNVPIDLTWSCYTPQNGQPCGRCLACTVRNTAMEAYNESSSTRQPSQPPDPGIV